MGIARSTFYDRPAVSVDDTALVERMVGIKDDPMALYRNAAALAARIPAAELLTLETGGHTLLGNDDAVASGVRRFVALTM